MLKRILVAAMLLAFAISPVPAQIIGDNPGPAGNGTTTPEPSKPSQSAGVVATGWRLGMACANRDITALADISAADRNGVSGRVYGASNGVESTISGGGVEGRQIRFQVTFYIVGKRNDEDWVGQISADGKSISGTLTGFWANDCRFTMTR